MKITRAMELIAASRIVKAQQRVEAARPYAELLTRAMEDGAHPPEHHRRDASAGAEPYQPRVREKGICTSGSGRADRAQWSRERGHLISTSAA
jgi:F-type H+-transporting ATPase subunit gamma